MTKLLSIISLILALVLFPPAALALISNNAVPGDATYPIKRTLEDGIFAIASLNPISKAWFAAARSDRRFKEFTTLIAQGKKGGETLNELVEQTQVAATQINQVKDEGQKQKLIQELSESIKKYDQGLQQVSLPSAANPAPSIQATPLSQVTPIPQETPSPTPKATSFSQPTPVPTAVSVPTPHVTTVPTPNPSDIDRQRQIDEARKQLEEIRKRLEEEQKGQREHNSQNESSRQQIRQESDDRKEAKQEKKEDSDGSEGRRKNNADTTK